MANWMMQSKFLDDMDGGLGDEVDPVDVVERARLLSKENDYPLKLLEGPSMLESQEVVIPGGEDYRGSSFNVVEDMLENNNVNRSFSQGDASDQACGSPRFMDDAGNMVEELMVRDYDSKLAIVGTSNNRERIQNRQTQWQHLYQLGGGIGSGSSHGRNSFGDNDIAIPSGWEDPPFNEILGQKALITGQQEDGGLLPNEKSIEDSRKTISHQGIRTKILSKSGFPEFFVKSTLKGKGIIFRGLPQEGVKPELRDELSGRAAIGASAALDDSIPATKVVIPSPVGTAPQMRGGSDGRSLREWLNAGRHKVIKDECLHIFRQIVEFLECYHSQGVALRDLRPSCFKLLQSNLVKYCGPPTKKKTREVTRDGDVSGSSLIRRRPIQQGLFRSGAAVAKKQKFSEDMNASRRWPQFTAKYSFASHADSNLASTKDSPNGHNFRAPTEDGNQGSSTLWLSNTAQQQMTSASEQSEERWYLSPEELAGGMSTMSSNIYSLGVLLFELLGRFDSEKSRATAMSDLRHRILPPNFLSEHSKEVGFCLLLLHPEPSSRPTARDILQAELIGGSHEVSAEELSSSIEQDDAESDLLMHFLSTLRENKQERAAELTEAVRCLEKDIEEIVRRKNLKESVAHAGINCVLLDPNERTSEHKAFTSSDVQARVSSIFNMEGRFLSNVDQLESAYFTMRSQIQHPVAVDTVRDDKDLLRNRETDYARLNSDEGTSSDCLGAFFDGLCKYARYTRFEVRGMLRTGDFNNSANVICSLSFDRDGDYFAAAGISKKIKIFEFNALFNDSVDIHYPAIEMSNKSKLSCICWNNYIKNYLASTGYDGIVKLWDVSTGQGISQFSEHEKRAWSVDFSPVYPTKFASGSDDCSVKLWNINEKNSLGTIRNIANVCCVQFSPYSTNLLAFGSADYRTYCYDLRNVRTPWCVLAGHDKAVSYVKFLDSETLVTASTDNSLKLWDLNKTSCSGVSNAACSSTLHGHTNEKNFVGLSVANGYVTCGSETNEVYSYYRSLPMPITSYKFGSIDPISGKETDDDNGLFVSSVCWRKDTDMVVAANSSGCIKVLQMV